MSVRAGAFFFLEIAVFGRGRDAPDFLRAPAFFARGRFALPHVCARCAPMHAAHGAVEIGAGGGGAGAGLPPAAAAAALAAAFIFFACALGFFRGMGDGGVDADGGGWS